MTETFNWSKDRIQVILLAGAQAMVMSGASLIMTITALTGAMLADDPAMATLPLAFQFVGMMCATIPASLFMGRVGRKIGFTVGLLIGAASALIAAFGIFQGNFWLFVVGSFGLGINNSFAAYLRFAAAEIVEKEHRPTAISYVMAGGIVAAFLGPWLATQTKEWFEPVLFAGGFVSMAGLYGIAMVVVWIVRFRKETPNNELHGPARPLMEIVKQPTFITAALAGTMGYGVMSLVMTATPLAMVACGLEFTDAAFVIQWHVLGMFLPSFFTGKLIQKYGVLNIILIGAILNGACMAIALAGLDLMNFWFALVALGVGWNFMFIGGSSLLTQCYRETERSKVQALNDFMVFGTVAAASFSSGAIQNEFGWSWVNLVVAVPMLMALLSVVWLKALNKRTEAVAGE
ncbi:MFS transporter [Terasakiella sp. A23]|uniref:MFS transporter n=1 Tax=Terasakiella sp. FCG-A23 TaxID=3080561 RepID=UPI0029540FE0|nr:MFS transporter [Terasakiella sp. A23]MDV7338155.1 MFS transporter [Terasakiella sp. A23]